MGFRQYLFPNTGLTFSLDLIKVSDKDKLQEIGLVDLSTMDM
jgi:hypothetical protein